ncbi:MAG TPA: hypothetical protein VLZ75_04960 [Chitinophagales bacterium]|nr:hypothetical protein [Chitinophagales bacterium]
MKNFTIQPLLKINGVSSASGISYSDGTIRLISDESNYLYEHNISENKTSRILLLDGAQTEQIIKAEKLDLESLTERDGLVYTFGSGSTPIRETGFSVNSKNQEVNSITLHHLYASMRTVAKIEQEDFNIESVTHDDKDWIFLNRGNGPGNRNVLIKVHGASLETNFQLSFTEFELPQMKDLPFGFSDATVVKNHLYFIATAEAGTSTYHDGEVGGSMIGIINLDNMKIEFTELISDHQKFEGITFYQQESDNNISFLLCEDNDDYILESTIFQINLHLK